LCFECQSLSFKGFHDFTEALVFVERQGAKNIVIKADNLMGGKGVVLPKDLDEAEVALKKLMVPGTPGEVVVIQQRVGCPENECSVTGITDGNTIHRFPFTLDHKRALDGNKGPNTGGMGAHTISFSGDKRRALRELLDAVVEALAEEGCPFVGFMYLGVMMAEYGPTVLECNCRLGDPEAQAILTSINGSFAELCMAAAKGGLRHTRQPEKVRETLCVVLASPEYPSSSSRDDSIGGIEEALAAGALIFHAGTRRKEDDTFMTNRQGRVLNVVGCGEALLLAHDIAYRGVRAITSRTPSLRCRFDIGGSVLPT